MSVHGVNKITRGRLAWPFPQPGNSVSANGRRKTATDQTCEIYVVTTNIEVTCILEMDQV